MRTRRLTCKMLILMTATLFGCGGPSESFNDISRVDPDPAPTVTPTPTPEPTPALPPPPMLYVASGSCYGGGVTTLTGSGTIAAFNTVTGALQKIVVDYNTLSPGDLPVAMVEYNNDKILVLVENSAGRRIDLVNKDGSGLSSYITNPTALSAILRSMSKTPDGGLLVSKSTSVEKFSAGKSRVPQGVNPYINAPASTCGTTATLITAVATLSNGKIIYAHSAATPNNKLAVIAQTGYSITADCLAAQAAPSTLAMPTALLMHSSGKLLVGYGSTTTTSNYIYSYVLNPTTNVFSVGINSFTDAGIINGPSALAEDTSTGNVFVANGQSTFNTVEKFSFNPTTQLMSRTAGPPFLNTQIFTRCVSDMKVFAK